MANQPASSVNDHAFEAKGTVSSRKAPKILTKECEGDRHHSHHYEHPPPRRQTPFVAQRPQQSSLNPATCHVPQVSEATEHGSAFAQLGLRIPRAIDEMCPDATRSS